MFSLASTLKTTLALLVFTGITSLASANEIGLPPEGNGLLHGPPTRILPGLQR